MIKYPNMKKSSSIRNSYTNLRGVHLEKDLNDSNIYYLETGKAVIYKKPTPINVVRVDYAKRSSAKIVEAYYQKPSTTDYSGVYRGKAIDFEAKETKSLTEFRLDLIHTHQIKHLERVLEQGAIAFLIVRFTTIGKTFLLDAKWIIKASQTINVKSVPLSIFEEQGIEIKEGYTPRLKYLDAVDQLYFVEVNNE